VSALVDPKGRPAFACPYEREAADAYARCDRDLKAILYGAGPRGTILDLRGEPLNRPAPQLSGLEAWLSPGKAVHFDDCPWSAAAAKEPA